MVEMLEQFQAFCRKLRRKFCYAGQVAAGPRKADGEAGRDRVPAPDWHDWYGGCVLFGRKRRWISETYDHIDMARDQFVNQPGQVACLALCRATLKREISVKLKTTLAEAADKCCTERTVVGNWCTSGEQADAINLRHLWENPAG